MLFPFICFPAFQRIRQAVPIILTFCWQLCHMELQSGNDAEMPLRMAEYALGVYRRFGQFPRQIVLYMGEPVLLMRPGFDGSAFFVQL